MSVTGGTLATIRPLAYNEVYSAVWYYSGIPAAVSGGLGAFGFNVALQAGQVKKGPPIAIFSAGKLGFGIALGLEASVGAFIFLLL